MLYTVRVTVTDSDEAIEAASKLFVVSVLYKNSVSQSFHHYRHQAYLTLHFNTKCISRWM